ncbi:MAG TPA: hypothetical protein VK447_10875, partial [Myxococcaceae bacterium]|nr:hypothetical protein [Myxococcaceae bacterium]
MMPPPQRPRRADKRSALLLGALLAGLVFAYRAFFLGGRVLAGRDAFRLSIPDSALLRELLGRFELPLWNPYLYLGQPFAGTLQSQAFYPPHLLTTLLFGPVYGYTVGHVLHAAIAAVGAYWLCRRLRCSPIASAFAAAAFGLSPLFADLGGLRNIASSAAWTGCLLAAAHRLARAPSFRRAGLLAVFAALSFLCGSPETLIWQAVLALLLINALGPKWRPLVTGIGAFAWAVGLAAVAALPAVELALHSTRGTGRAHPLAWSASWAQLLSLVWPFADQPRGAYWGPDQWLLLTLFVGSCTGLLGLVALRGSRRLEPFVLGVILFGALALGAHLAPSAWLLTHPPLHLFRYPAKYLVGVCFCLAVLAAFGLDRLAVLARRVRPSPLRVGLVLGGTMGLLAALLAVTRYPPFRPGAQHGALWLVLFGAALATAFFAIPGGPRRSRRVRAAATFIATLELSAVHLTQVGAGWAEPGKLLAPSTLANALPRPFEGRISLDVYGEDHGGPGTLASTSVMEASRDALIPNSHLEERLPALEGYGAPEPERVPEFHLAGSRALFDLAGVTAYVRAGPPPFEDLMEVPVPPGLPRLYRSTTAL